MNNTQHFNVMLSIEEAEKEVLRVFGIKVTLDYKKIDNIYVIKTILGVIDSFFFKKIGDYFMIFRR